jgi:hypothetical protein
MPLKLSTFIIAAFVVGISAATAAEPDSASAAAAPATKPVVAVYVTGGVPDMKTFFGTYLSGALVNAGGGISDETSAAFLAASEEERSTRNADTLDDSLICELGRKFGIRYVCVAAITPMPDAFALTARVMSTKTGKSRYHGGFTGPLNVMEDLERATTVIVENMFGGKRVFDNQPASKTEPVATANPPLVQPQVVHGNVTDNAVDTVNTVNNNTAPKSAVDNITDNATAAPAVHTVDDIGTDAEYPPVKPYSDRIKYVAVEESDIDEQSGVSAEHSWADVAQEPAPVAAAPQIVAPNPKLIAAEDGKQIVAVYMAGEEPQGAKGVHSIIGGELARVMSESDRYVAVDRTETILEQLDREHVYQRSGAVDDAQIKAIGHQLGVEYLCISSINPVGKRYYLDTRLVDVVTAEIKRSVTATSTLKDANEMAKVGGNIALELLEAEKARRNRKLRKSIFRYTAIGLDILGAGALAYGYMENNNVVKHTKVTSSVKSADGASLGRIADGPEADRAATRRNAAYITGGALVAAGVTIHIVF